MLIRGLALVTALAPIIGINLAYWLGVQHDNLPFCNPYIDGCTSISSTGRYPPGDRLFRAVLLPQAALLALTWYFAVLWLRSLGSSPKAERTTLITGLPGALALIVYVSYLASNDPFYEIMRRYGVYLYFFGTAFAQIAVTVGMPPSPLRRTMAGLLVLMFVLGLFNFGYKAWVADLNSMENRIEWVVSFLMQAWFVALFFAWRRSDFRLDASTR